HDVVTAGGEPAAVRTEPDGQVESTGVMPYLRSKRAVRDRPEQDAAIGTAGGERLAVWQEGNAREPLSRIDRGEQLAAAGLIDAASAVDAGEGDGRAVGVEGDPPEGGAEPRPAEVESPGFSVPEPRGTLIPGGGDTFAVGAETGGDDPVG